MKTVSDIFKSKLISLKLKMRTFTAFINSVMLYNSELWTVTKQMEENINVFQRRQLRIMLNRTWPKPISNEQLYSITEVEPWNITINMRRLKWTGHLLCLPPQTPARRSLAEVLKPVKRKQGRPSLNWIQQIIKDVRDIKLVEIQKSNSTKSIFSKLKKLATDRIAFRKKSDCYIPRKGCLRQDTSE